MKIKKTRGRTKAKRGYVCDAVRRVIHSRSAGPSPSMYGRKNAPTHTYTHTQTDRHTYVYIYIYII